MGFEDLDGMEFSAFIKTYETLKRNLFQFLEINYVNLRLLRAIDTKWTLYIG